MNPDESWTQTKTLLAIERAMTPDERRAFLGYFVDQLNPHLRGAHVADVLGMLHDGDAHLDVCEPMFEAHSADVPEPYLLWLATLACVGIYIGGGLGVEVVNWQRVAHLVERVRSETPRARAVSALTGVSSWPNFIVGQAEAELLVMALEGAGLCIVNADEGPS